MPITGHAVFSPLLLAAAAGLLAAMAAPEAASPDDADRTPTLVVRNARVWTANPVSPWAEALAVAGDRLLAVGSTREIDALAAGSPARVIDAGGRLVTPGFIDAHVHFIEGGFRLASVQLRDAASKADFIERIKAFAATVPAGTWITGGDWDHEAWGGELPTRSWIDAVTPHHPVWVNRLDGHMALANSLALQKAGVDRTVAPIEGGVVERDDRGEPTGLLRDNAMGLVERAVPAPSPEMVARALDAAQRYVAERGVTSVHHMGTWDDLEAFVAARSANRLTTRIYAAVPLATWNRLHGWIQSKLPSAGVARAGANRPAPAARPGDDWLRFGMLKGFVDGSLGSHTAAFEAPFTDAPADRGLLVTDEDTLYRQVSAADRAGLHVAIHAIGDRANRVLLDIYERVARENGPRDRRFRIEHAQHLRPADIPRFAALGVIASMQPYHAIDDGRWAERVIGPERSRTTYAFRALLGAGAHVAFGSDWFVAPPTPLEGVYAAVTRRTLDGKQPGGWVPDQKITVEDALKAYTREGAFAGFDEARKGQLSPGMLADLVILDRDAFRVPPETLRDLRVDVTVAGGRVVWERKTD